MFIGCPKEVFKGENRVALTPESAKELQKLGNCIDVSNEKNKKEKIKENIIDTEVVIVRSDTQINKELIDISKKLKIIGRSGVGTDNIDLAEASSRKFMLQILLKLMLFQQLN